MPAGATTTTRYAAFLRGINVGGKNKIAMSELRALAEALGYSDVRTYINSGNLLFSAEGSDLELAGQIERAITEQFGKSIDVAVRTEARLRDILLGNPYPDQNASQVTVAFLTRPAPATAPERVAALATDGEPVTFSGLEVWVNYTNGMADSKLAAQFSKAVGVSATVRNVRTVGKVVALFD